MNELKVEAAVASNETLYQTGEEPIIWVVLRGSELMSVHMTEADANLMLIDWQHRIANGEVTP